MGGEERSSREYWVDKCSTNNCFLKFFVVPGEIRKCLNELVPSAWNERESVIWHYDEGGLDREWCIERETELYKLKRDYNELKEVLNDMKYLPVQIESDDTGLNNNDVIYDDKIIDLVLRKITYRDWTKLIE